MSDYDYGGDYGGDYDGGGVAPPKKAGMSKAKIGGIVAALLVVGGVVALAVVLSSGGGGEEEKISEDPIKAGISIIVNEHVNLDFKLFFVT